MCGTQNTMDAATAAYTTQMQPTSTTPTTNEDVSTPDPLKRQNNISYILSGLGTLVQQNANNDYYTSLINQANTNAQMAKEQIYTTGIAGNTAANDARRQGRMTTGEQTAQMGASGFSSTSGSSADVQAATAMNAEENAQRITYNTMLKQWGLQNEANAYAAQASNLAQAQKNASTANLLTGASNLYKLYNNWKGVTG